MSDKTRQQGLASLVENSTQGDEALARSSRGSGPDARGCAQCEPRGRCPGPGGLPGQPGERLRDRWGLGRPDPCHPPGRRNRRSRSRPEQPGRSRDCHSSCCGDGACGAHDDGDRHTVRSNQRDRSRPERRHRRSRRSPCSRRRRRGRDRPKPCCRLPSRRFRPPRRRSRCRRPMHDSFVIPPTNRYVPRKRNRAVTFSVPLLTAAQGEGALSFSCCTCRGAGRPVTANT